MELTIDRLTKRYGPKLALDGLSVSLRPGITGLLGPNGAGKTTLLRLLATILPPSGGEIRLDGTPIAALGERYRARLGYLPQEFGYYPSFTAEEFLLYLGAVKGLPKPFAQAEARRLLEETRLSGAAQKKIRTLSGGMKQRLGVAQALLGSPALLLLDEPTAGLDPKERVRLYNLLARYADGRHIVLLSTHLVADVESVADRVLVLKAGRRLRGGAPDELLEAVRGRVWTCTVPPREAEALCARHIVVAVRPGQGGTRLRLVADGPPCAGAEPARPGLDDLYQFDFREEEDDAEAGGA